ncbi:hypothetical protein BH23VER1_BH23VER1_34550 [soil metagenome]
MIAFCPRLVVAAVAGFVYCTGAMAAPPERCLDDGAAAVVFFILHDCPVSNQLTPEMNAIAARYEKKGIRFTFAEVDPAVAADELAEHAKAYAIKAAITIDRQHRLVDLAGADVAPAAAVFLPDGSLAYQGRINNLFEAFGQKRAVVTDHNLREALDAVLAGEKGENEGAGPPAVGCYIADLKR